MAGSVILHIPHSSLTIPAAVRSELHITDAELSSELLRMTDWHTNWLFDPGDLQVLRVVFPYSRLVCDVERFPDDASEPMSAKGMGAIYERMSDGKLLRDRMSGEARNSYLERYYYPHHRELQELTERVLVDRQRCMIVDCHSFSSIPLPCDLDQTLKRPDICIGTDPVHTPLALVRQIENACLKLGLSVSVDRPYTGTMIPDNCFGTDKHIESIMIEVRRGLYVDETTGLKLATFESIRKMVHGLLRACHEFHDWQC